MQSAQFPTLGAGSVRFITLELSRYPELDGKQRFAAVPGLPNITEQLIDARQSEAVGRRDRGVLIQLDATAIVDRSYGLALAIADKRLEYGGPATSIVATGVLVDRGQGRIGPVSGLGEKAAAVADMVDGAPEPVVFAFPIDQETAIPSDVARRLHAQVQAGKLRLAPCRQLDDLDWLWLAPGLDRPHRRRRGASVAAVALLIFAVSAWGGYPRWLAHECETDAEALNNPNMSARAIAAAVASCDRALDRQPDHGRLAFLAGQAHAANGGGQIDAATLALFARSARQGDANGQIVYAQAVWLEPSWQANRREAKGLLERAARNGDTAAAEQLGVMTLIGNPNSPPGDGSPEAAAPWFRASQPKSGAAPLSIDDRQAVKANRWQDLGRLGLLTSLDRPIAQYPVGTTIGVAATTRRPSVITIWRIETDGTSVLLASRPAPSGQLALTISAQGTGLQRLLVAAWPMPTVRDYNNARGLEADTMLAGSDRLAVQMMRLAVVGPA
ncbi:hypothetical protein [Sandarakinorhabdus sp.]|uniref:hypothetical protein n=1 Tax=Sandarakinorhabdus sp. TaxID=1916663 RepID=UPI003F6E5878